ncbi:PAS domain S-box protein [Gilvimarinus agarilyticus]|uniref:PAS domain S-box protein n=1 Tax=Gilvimarinus agarilyticus TaxID=679259 RepID=UPI000ADFD89F|nr:PAS domain S-box protein [Gilvimarinus agarilyticus]
MSVCASGVTLITANNSLALMFLAFICVSFGAFIYWRLQRRARRASASQASSRRLQLALENSQSGYWDWDVRRDSVEFSDDWRRMFGVHDDAVIGDGVSEWMARVHPQDRDECLRRIKAHIKGETDRFEHEHRLRDERGEYLWFLTRGRVTERDSAGKALQVIGVYTDVTARKHVEELVVHQQQALHRLNEIASLPSTGAKQQLRQALRLGADYLRLPLGIVSEVNGDDYRIHVQVSPADALSDNQVFHLPHCFCVETLHGQDVMAVHHTGRSSLASHPCYQSTQLECYIGAPVWVKGNVFGTLNFSAPEARANEFSDYERDFVRVLARWVGATLERSLQEREGRKLSETFARLSDSMPGCLIQFQKYLDGSSRIAYASRGIWDIYGVTPEQVQDDASDVFSRLHPDDLERIATGIAESESNLTMWNDQYRVLHPSRGERWVRGRTTPERQSDGSIIWHGSLWDVTEEVMAEQQLSRTRRWRDAIFDVASLSLIITDVHGVIQSVNVGASRMLGYNEQELLIKGNLTGLHEERGELDGVFAELASQATDNVANNQERVYLHKDGRHVRVMETIMAVRDEAGQIEGFLSVARDITLERSQEEALASSAERTQAILDNAADGIVLIADDGSIISFNLAAEKIFGLSASQAEGRAIECLLSVTDADTFVRQRLDPVSGSIELKGRRANAEEFPLELTFSEIHSDGERLYIALMRDITDRKRIERMKNEFIATVSHELRTPLTAISGSLRLLDSGVLAQLPESIKKLVQVAHNNSDRLLALINDLLDIEKLVAGKVRLKLEPLAVVRLLQESIENNASYAEQFNVRLRLDTSSLTLSPEQYLIYADSQRIAQVVTNLISNAAKFSYSGGEVVVQMQEQQGELIISVVDQGEGVADDFRHQVFEKFSQADSSSTKGKGGTGLGLAISKEIIDKHGGRIGFESKEGHGSRFFFALPATVLAKLVDNTGAPKIKILQVEDDRAILQVVELVAANAAQLTQVTSLAAAQQALGQARFDMILLDVLLPDGSGLQWLRSIVDTLPAETELVALTQVELDDAEQQLFDRVIIKNANVTSVLSECLRERVSSLTQ